MKKLILATMLLVHGCCSGVYAQLTPNTQTVFDYVRAPMNFVINPHGRLNTNNITVSSSPLAVKGRATGTSEIKKLASNTCNTTGLNGYCEVALNTIDPELVRQGNMCDYTFVYNGDASLNSLALGGVAVRPMVNTSGSWSEVTYSQACSTFPTFRMLQTTAGTGQTVKYFAYAGRSLNIGTVAQATFWGGASQPGATNCNFSENTSTAENNYVDLANAASCASAWTSTKCTVSGPTSPQLICSDLPPGEYQLQVSAAFYNSTSGNQCNFKISDGTTQFGFATIFTTGLGGSTASTLTGHVSYNTSGTRTFKIQASDDGATTCGIANTIAGRQFIWRVYRYPAASETVVSTVNLDSADRIAWAPTAVNLGAGSGTLNMNFTYATTNGMNLNLCLNFTKDGTNGTGSGLVNWAPPAGYTFPANQRTLGSGSGGPATTMRSGNLIFDSGSVFYLKPDGNYATGADFPASSYVSGCIPAIPTTNKKPTNGVAFIDPLAVSIKYVNTAGTSIGTGTVTPITYATKVWDSHNAWNGTTLTPPYNGRYRFCVTTYYASAAWTVGAKSATIRKNNILSAYAYIYTPAATYTNDLGANGCGEIELTTADTATIAINHNEGAAKSFSNAAETNVLTITRLPGSP